MTQASFLLAGPVEVRFLGRETWAIFTEDPALIREALLSPSIGGLSAYITLNELKAGTPERHGVVRDMLFHARKNQLTKDEDIARRRFILLDSDPLRPTGTAATEPQRSAAHSHSERLEEALTAEGWPAPIVCDSGNAHRLYAVDLPINREADVLVSNLLHAAARKFDTAEVKLDKSVSNAARVTRLYGTRNQKAGRDSAVLFVPNTLIPVTVDELKSTVEKWRGTLGYQKPLTQRAGDWTPEKMEAFLDFYGLDYRAAVPIPAGLLWVLTPCPLNDDHAGTSPAVLLTKNGWPKFRCMHNSCSGLRWADFCKRLHNITGKWFIYVS
jgi:hypothetical protein